MEKIVEFFLVYLVVAGSYYIVFARKRKKYDKKNLSVEMLYLMYVYNIDFKKINYKWFNISTSLVNGFIIAIVYMVVVYLVKGFIFQLVIGMVLLLLLIIICYGLMAKIYIKKGVVKCTTSKK